MKKRLLLSLILLLPLLAYTAMAREAVMRFYTINDGLQNNQARQVISLPKERRILVTLEGAFEWFDGQRFHSMNVDRQQTLHIENFFSQTHHLDRKDRLWVRDYHRVYLFDAHTLRQLPVDKALAKSGLHLEQLQNLFFDSDDDMWVSTDDGALWHYDWKNKAHCVSDETQSKANICDVVQVGHQVFILKMDGNIDCYDKTNRRWIWTKKIGDHNAGRRFKALPWDKENFLLRSDGGLFKFNIITKENEIILDDNNIYDFCLDTNGGLWVSGRYLLWHLDRNLQRTEPYTIAINKTDKKKAESDWMGITIDWQGNMWACKQSDGVGYMNPSHNIISHQTIIDSTHSVRSIISQNGYTIAATTRGVFRQTNNKTDWVQIHNSSSFPHNHVSFDKAGRLWASGADGFIVKIENIDALTPQIKSLDNLNTSDSETPKTTNWESVPFCIPLNNSNKLLTCVNNNNVCILDPETQKIEPLRDRFPELRQLRHIVAALQLDDGFLIGSQNGLVWYNSSNNIISIQETEALNNNPYSDKCNCMLKDSKGNVWIGTQNGLLQVEHHDSQWTIVKHIGKGNGLPSNCIISLIEDAKNNLWVATYTGICCLSTSKDGETYVSIILRDEDGVNCPELQERSACLCADGTILFGSRHGYYRLNPQLVFKKQDVQKPVLLEYAVCDTIKNIRLSDLNYLQNKLSFIISTLNYAAPQHVQYRYRLQGSSHDQWITADGKDGCIHIEYNLLPHGHYKLEVQSRIMAQKWSDALLIDICITPPWWKSWWAWTMYVVFIIVSTYASTMVYLRTKRQRLEQRQLIAQLMAQLSEKENNKSVVEEPTSRLSAKDRAFIDNLNLIINENISNENLDTVFLANKLLISRTSLYRKMKSLLGIGANEYIRKVRLHKAKEMLENGEQQMLNITGIALECGFTSMSHFRSCFKDEFGVLPGEIGKE